MADGPGIETHAHYGNSTTAQTSGNGSQAQARRDGSLKRVLWFVGIAAVTAGLAYAVVRVTTARPTQDPTTERIQSLIDEANRLLKQLDDKKSG
jgi:NAD(P)H-dependent FMN reductase